MRKITAKLKSDMIFDLHTHFGDASDPYAARGARELVNALVKPENASDLNTYFQAKNKLDDSHTDKEINAAYNEYTNVVNTLCEKFIPDNWSKNDLNWP